MDDIVGLSQFSGTSSYYYAEVESTNSVTPPATGYENKSYKFIFPEGEIYDNMRLIVDWKAFSDIAGTDGIRQTVPIEQCEIRIGSQLLNTTYFDNYATQFKNMNDKDQRVIQSMYNFTLTEEGDRAVVQEILPIITPHGGFFSRDVKSSSTSIPVPYGVGQLEIKITLRNPFTVGGTSADPELDGITMLCDVRKYRDPSDKNRALNELITSPVPFLVHDTVILPPVLNQTSSAAGGFPLIQFDLSSLAESNVQYIVIKAFATGDTEGMSPIIFNWDSPASGIYEKGVLTKVIRTSSGVRAQMINSGNSIESNSYNRKITTPAYQWTDGELIISANVSPITELERWIPDYFPINSNPSFRLNSITGFAAATAYDFYASAVRLVGWSMSNARKM